MATRDACACKSVPTSSRWRRIRLGSAVRTAGQVSGFAGVSSSTRAPAPCCIAMPTGPLNTTTFFAGWQPGPKILTGASRVRGSGLKVWTQWCCGPVRPRSSARQQAGKLGIAQVAPLSGTERPQMNVHDAHALQAPSFVAQSGAHAADLAIQSLGENHAEGFLIDAADFAGFGELAHDFDAARHHLQRKIGDRTIHGHDVFLLMIVLGTQYLVDDVAVVGQQDQTLRVLVQPSNRKDALGIPHQIDDVVLDMSFGGAGNSHRLVQSDVDLFFLGADRLAVDAYHIALADLGSQGGGVAVAGHAPRIDPLVRLAPRADAGFADVLIESQ